METVSKITATKVEPFPAPPLGAGEASVVELFYSLQGEGCYTGQAAVFIRLAGCRNACPWCDAKDTWNADKFPRVAIADIVRQASAYPARIAVVTGGEPLLHDLGDLCRALKQAGFRTHLETSGVAPFSGEWDWVCLSPKCHRPPLAEAYAQAHELKVVIENKSSFEWAEENAQKVSASCLLYLQPEWGQRQTVVPLITEYIKQHPQWRLSLQTHKFLNIP